MCVLVYFCFPVRSYLSYYIFMGTDFVMKDLNIKIFLKKKKKFDTSLLKVRNSCSIILLCMSAVVCGCAFECIHERQDWQQTVMVVWNSDCLVCVSERERQRERERETACVLFYLNLIWFLFYFNNTSLKVFYFENNGQELNWIKTASFPFVTTVVVSNHVVIVLFGRCQASRNSRGFGLYLIYGHRSGLCSTHGLPSAHAFMALW